jgi:hypothetical protein
MIPPETQNGPGGSSRSRQGQYDQKAAEDTSKIARRTDKRHVPGQLPIVRSATVWPIAAGLKTSPILLDDPCDCGDYHQHRNDRWPAPASTVKSARCGVQYDLFLHPPKAMRGRRAA